jgi:uncharacterized cofD-like protein
MSGKGAPRIALIGAGTGQAQLLRGLRDQRARVKAIVGITDNGGHSGLLRRELGIPAVGDLRNCLAALAPTGSAWERLLGWRFTEGALDGVSPGNLALAALTRSLGSLALAAERVAEAMGTAHRALPVADADAQVGEWEALRRKDPSPIARVFHKPAFQASPAARAAVEKADGIVLCPGTLYTGVLSCAVARGLPEALRRSRGRFAMVLNIMTQPGQTLGLTARGHVEAVERALGRRPDAVILNRGRPAAAHLRLYARLGAKPVLDDLGKAPGIVRADLVYRGNSHEQVERGRSIPSLPHLIRHDPKRLAWLVWEALKR